MFDMIKCEFYLNSMERYGYASEKNMVLKDFYISFSQIEEFKEGKL